MWYFDCHQCVVSRPQSRHSLCHPYDFLFTDVLSFREELQFVSRLRYLGRQDVRGRKHAWIQQSLSNRSIASMKRLKNDMVEIAHTSSGVPAFLASIMASVPSELADTSNPHTQLWREEYIKSNATFIPCTKNRSRPLSITTKIGLKK